jgi:hypothetical protein
MLNFLDTPLNLRPTQEEIAALREGQRGLRHGHKPHVFDAMEILKEVLEQQISIEGIQRCWVKSGCLPDIPHRALKAEVGDSDRKVAHMNRNLPQPLKSDIDALCDIVTNFVNATRSENKRWVHTT